MPSPRRTPTTLPTTPSRSRRHRWIAGLAAVAVGVVALGGLALRSRDNTAVSPGSSVGLAGPVGAQVGQGVPALSVKTVSGSTFSLPAGKPTVVFFMTGECGSCIAGAKALDAVERQYGDRLAILAVDTDPSATTSSIQGFRQAVGNPRYGFAADPDGRIDQAFAVYALDTMVISDAAGKVVQRGVITDEAGLRSALAKAGVA